MAPLVSEAVLGGAVIEKARKATMQLTCIAGFAGLPVVNIPLVTVNGLPCGVSLVGPANRDADLVALAVRLSESRLNQRKNEHA